MVPLLILGCALGAGFAAYRHNAAPLVIFGFVLAGAAFGFLLSRFRHWED
jgi:uncharacterized membrane protein YfcA